MLSVRGLEVRYGAAVAVRDVSLEAGEGRVTALLGANGTGKTTTMLALSGILRATRGEVRFEGQDVTNLPNDHLVRLGIVQVPQGRQVFPQMSVADNVDLGAFLRRPTDAASDRERVYALFPRLAERRSQLAGTLSGGEQQMLAIGRALMARPRLLLLDEPSLGLAPIVVDAIYTVIRDLEATGLSVLLAEQDTALALDVASHGYVFESGRLAAAGPADELRSADLVQRAYLGAASAAAADTSTHQAREGLR